MDGTGWIRAVALLNESLSLSPVDVWVYLHPRVLSSLLWLKAKHLNGPFEATCD